jgi:shikimate dehydrogenase
VGFRRAFEETLGERSARGQSILLLGAGGAGRAAAVALLGLGASRLRIFDSDTPRALRLFADLTKHFGAGHCEALPSAEPAAASVAGIVNATPVGMSGFPGMPLSPHLIEPRHFVADVIYSPIDTDFVLAAKAKGCRTMNGGGMCVHQAVEAFRLFTGRMPDVDRMRRTFEAALAERDAAAQA